MQIENDKELMEKVKLLVNQHYEEKLTEREIAGVICLKYPWKPLQCHQCNVFGHDEVHCSQKAVIPEENEVLRDEDGV